MVVAVVFSITFKNAESEQAFLDAFAKLQQHCIHNEPGTLTYELHQVFDQGEPVPFQYIVLERYSNLYHFEEVHLKSSPFRTLFRNIGELEVSEQTLRVATNVAAQPTLDAKPDVWSENDIEDPLLRKGVLVFCGARHGNKPAYAEEARALATYIVEELKQPLVYGGGTVGVMGTLANEVKDRGGKIISVIPGSLSSREVSGQTIGDLIYTTATMSERKSIMFAHANTVVALPGGVGTFDELLEVLTLFQLNAYRPKIGIVNVEGFFDPFLALLHHLVAEGFLEEKIFGFVVIKPTAVELMKALRDFVPPPSPAASLVWKSRP
ncbi:lysine decarboxylase-like protein [Leptomonas pyrrhocoris]|uniref:Lysine decarboxylase-like protein n=1 Tax=Leptomonas pyrrhocoris TaxID=157538 RepID=A0A0M9FUC4_LEPPY|nr:lysine decarboxylase-like protein [Leptomonas pyrrhocoris]XP_015654633.1 lysine decarboxylase-like protein [Leptomonas pyrrhocoris]KPA76193.1 lysine decarboxylase-like protein [Leptomonas pyrrhocoris]KPA76194.1 lysine decarboxylase-like protein [Leptomonas pyrrhocoris]|eukprot:XP_015654632.1 lysine decarboxylase-like protein [Leptomonas pyrrhocoris]